MQTPKLSLFSYAWRILLRCFFSAFFHLCFFLCFPSLFPFFFFFCNLNRQSEFTFYKLMLWLLQCLNGESSSGESLVPQIRSIGQFLLNRLFSSLNRNFLRSVFSWVSSLVWWLLHCVFICLLALSTLLHADRNITCNIHWTIQCSRMLKYSIMTFLIANDENVAGMCASRRNLGQVVEGQGRPPRHTEHCSVSAHQQARPPPEHSAYNNVTMVSPQQSPVASWLLRFSVAAELWHAWHDKRASRSANRDESNSVQWI
jgi:hypothetical protein